MSKIYYIIFIFLYYAQITFSENIDNDDIYFQLYPSENKDEPYGFHVFNLKSEDYYINSTEKETMKAIRITKNEGTPISHLSSMMTYNNTLLVKTCFGPNKIIEIIGENKETFTPNNDYFKNVKNNLENIKYCYTTMIYNPEKLTEYIIITYWIEAIKENGLETYVHKSILFYPEKKKFSDVFIIETNKDENFYPESCTNQRFLYIYCTINPSFPLSKTKHIFIDPTYFSINQIKLKLVTIVSRLSSSIYHKPIGLVKSLYTDNGKRAEFFLTEYHDKDRNITRLSSSLYVNSYNMTFILRFEEFKIDHGINIEDVYIEPKLFNHLIPNIDEIIIIYIMKGINGNNLLLLNRFDYEKSLKVRSKFDNYILNNYLRDDICKNPQYMQSMYIKSFINYENKDKEIIKNNPDKEYFKYQTDIATIISCKKDNNEIEYQYLKITMPQCLSDLGKINGIDSSFKFDKQTIKIILDIYNNPNFISLRNVEIIFGPSDLYNRIIIIQAVKNGERALPINGTTTILGAEYLEFSRTINFQRNKIYRIPYRVRQTGISGVSSKCHLTSDWCYLEFTYPIKTGETPEICTKNVSSYCKEEVNCTCEKCYDEKIDGYKYIIGEMSLDKNKECICDIKKGFKKYPRDDIRMCVCEDNYSFYKDRYMCLPNNELNNGSFCIEEREEQDELSKIYFYHDLKGRMIYKKNGLPYCFKSSDYTPDIWFPMGDYSFSYVKLENDCVYIIYKKTGQLIMYSDKNHCQYDDDFDYIQYFNKDIKSKEDYDNYLNEAIEFQPDNENFTLIRDDLDSNITFFIQNDYITQNFKNLSIIDLSQECLEKISNEQQINITKFVANIKRNNTRSTQVEYQIYNTKQIEHNLDLSVCSKVNESQIVGRRLQSDNNINININSDVNITVNINWRDNDAKNIEELYDNNGIFLFNSSDPFYNDVCYKYRTPKGHDIYLQNRKEQYYVNESICEANCTILDYDNITKRIICGCDIKVTPENYEYIQFYPEQTSEEYNKTFTWPNLKIISCVLEADISHNPFNYILFLLIIVFVFSYYYFRKWRCSKKHKKKLEYDDEFEDLFELINGEDNELKNKSNNKEHSDNGGSDDDDDEKFRQPPKENNNNNEQNQDNHSSKPEENNENKGVDENNIINTNLIDKEEGKKEEKKDEDNKELIDKEKENKENKELIDNEELIQNEENKKEDEKKSEGPLILIENIQEEKIGENDNNKENKKDENIVDINSIKTSKVLNENSEKLAQIEKDLSLEYKKEKESKEQNEVMQSIVFNSLIDENNPTINAQNKYDQDSDINIGKSISNPPKKNNKNEDKKSDKSSNKGGNIENYSYDEESNSSDHNTGGVQYEDKKLQQSSEKRMSEKKKKKKKGKRRIENNNKEEDQKTTDIIEKNPNKGQSSEEDDSFTKDMFVYYEDFINNDKRDVCRVFISLLKYNSIIYFIFCDCKKKKSDQGIIYYKYENDWFTKLSVLILSFNLFIFYNILTEFDLSTLHYLVHSDDGTDVNGISRFLFCLVVFLYIPILFIKGLLSRREFIWFANRRLEELKKENEKGPLTILKHSLKTQVNEYKNKMEKTAEWVCRLGLIFLLFNLYLVACFLGIYNNSFWCLFSNVLLTILIIFISLLGILLLSAILRRFSRLGSPEIQNNEKNDNNERNESDDNSEKKNCCRELFEYHYHYIFFMISRRLNPAYYLYNESKIDKDFTPDSVKEKYEKKYSKKKKKVKTH